MTTAARTPAVGDPVFFEGLPHTITQLAGDKVEYTSELTYTGSAMDADGNVTTVTQPAFRTVGFAADLIWSDELGAWYPYGRVLNKGRGVNCAHCTTETIHPITKKPIRVKAGCVHCDQRRVVAALRDRGILPGRETREIGQGPAAGEQHTLHCCLFKNGVNWAQEIGNVKRGEGLSDAANACCAQYHQEYQYKLPHGYAYRGANDSTGKERP